MKLYAEFGAWIEVARDWVCYDMNQQDHEYPWAWRGVSQMIRRFPQVLDDFREQIQPSLSLTLQEWDQLEKFYDARCHWVRNTTAPAPEALDMLKLLPAEHAHLVPIFTRLIHKIK